MLRDNFVTLHRPVPAIYKTDAAMKTGMAVVIDDATKTVKFPTAATADNIYFVDKERIAESALSQASLSDYDDLYVNLAKGDFAKLRSYIPGEEFFTDAKGTATVGKTVAAGADGKLVDATAASRYFYVEDYNDNGHTLMKIRVLDTPAANA